MAESELFEEEIRTWNEELTKKKDISLLINMYKNRKANMGFIYMAIYIDQ